MTQLAEYLPSVHEVLCSVPTTVSRYGGGCLSIVPAPMKQEQEDKEFKVILSHIMNSRPPWPTFLKMMLLGVLYLD